MKPKLEPTFAVTRQVALRAAKKMDVHYSFCFHLCEDGKFCGRAKKWRGQRSHKEHHEFVSLADLLRGIT